MVVSQVEVITLDQLIEFVDYILKLNQHLQLSQICIESNSFTSNCHMNQYANLDVYTFPSSLYLSYYPQPLTFSLCTSPYLVCC